MRSLTDPIGLQRLADLAEEISEGVIVELGVYRGGSLKRIAERAQVPVYGIDPWGAPGEGVRYNRLLRGYGIEHMAIAARAVDGKAALIRGFSTEVAEGWELSVGMLYIDAVHERDSVLADFRAWEAHLLDGAVVAFDDHNERFPGVIQAVAELHESGSLKTVEIAGSVYICRWRP